MLTQSLRTRLNISILHQQLSPLLHDWLKSGDLSLMADESRLTICSTVRGQSSPVK
jgi:hypothetical protein